MSTFEAPRVAVWFLAALLLLVLLLVALFLLSRIVAAHFKGNSGGWGGLALAYGAPEAPSGQILKHETLVVGKILYRNCVTVGLTEGGLGLATDVPFGLFRKPALFIPWTEVAEEESARLYWQEAVLLRLGTPVVGSITVPMRLYEKIRAFLPKGVRDRRAPA